jgi:hypothetical protein
MVEPTDHVPRTHPTWSADGSLIYFSTQRSGHAATINASPAAGGWGDAAVTPDDGYDYYSPDAGPGNVLVAMRQLDDGAGNPTGPTQIVQIDPVTMTVTVIVTDGRQPAVAQDGQHVAFVRSDGTHDQIWATDMAGGHLVQVTANAESHRFPLWWASGSEISFSGESHIATASPLGTDKDAPIVATSIPNGFPAFQPSSKDAVNRLAGPNRFATAVATSQAYWATANDAFDLHEHAQAAVLTRSDTFADAVSGSVLAAAKHGPLLMTPPDSFDPSTKAEIQRIFGTTAAHSSERIVYILGSVSSVSASTEQAIQDLGYKTKRLMGSDRFATSAAIAQEINPHPNYVMLATGMNFPDALGAGAAAGSYDAHSDSTSAVVLLSNDGKMPTATQSYLTSWAGGAGNSDALFAVGKQAATAFDASGWTNAYNTLAGSNRYDTARQVANEFFGGETRAGVAVGINWPDALAGGALCGSINAALLLAGGGSALETDTQTVLYDESGSVNTALIFGNALPDLTLNQIGAAISGAGQFNISIGAPFRSAVKTVKAALTAGR